MSRTHNTTLGFLLCICLFININQICAQNNPYKINDRLYDYFVEVNKVVRSDVSLSMADTMFNMSAKMHDQKAQCLALVMKNMHYYYAHDFNNMVKSQKILQDFAKKTPYKQYIFDPWNRLINYYINNSRVYDALNEAKKYQVEAVKLNNSYGMSHCYRKLGDIYDILGDDYEAIKLYNKALDIQKELNDYNNISDVYYGLANSYCTISDYIKAKHFYRLAYNTNKKKGTYSTTVGLFRVFVSEGTDMDSIEYYRSLSDKEYKAKTLTPSNIDMYINSYAEYYILKKDYNNAAKYANLSESEITRYYLNEKIYSLKGDYYNAYKNLQLYLSKELEINNRTNQEFLGQVTTQIEQSRLEREKNMLEINNAKMKLQQSMAHERLMLLERNQTTLELNNKQLALDRQKSEIVRSKLETSRALLLINSEKEKIQNQQDRSIFLEKQDRDRKRTLILLSLIFGMIIIFSTIFIYHRQRQNMQLKREKAVALNALNIADKERKKAEQADNLKTLFLQNMSHEIRTPLNAIVGFSDLLNSEAALEVPPDKKKEMSEIIRTNSDLLLTLVNDILDLSKLESGTYKTILAETSAKHICDMVIRSVQSRVPANVELRTDLPCDDIIFNTDAKRIEQLLINLLTNACKYTSKGVITLCCHPKFMDGDSKYMQNQKVIEFSVIDTGSGIPTDMKEKIFNRFEKLDNFKQGTGLGLSICKQIAMLLKGEIYVDTEYKKGARFVFLHPLS